MLQLIVRAALLLWLLCLPANGTPINYNKEIDTYFESVLNGVNYSLSSDIIKGAESKKILKLAGQNIGNINPQVRYKIIDLVKRKALVESDFKIKKKFVQFLIESAKDPDSGNSGVASKSLTLFAAADFDKQAGDSIYCLLLKKPYHYDQVIKLAGFLNFNNCHELLQKKLVSDSLLTAKDKWVIYLALARMGDSTSMKFCFEKVKTQPLSDKMVTYIYPDLVYTRQPVAINYLLSQILSDSKECCSPSPETDEKTICAFKIMELVAPVITNFPIQVTAYGDLEIDNYGDALTKVQNWLLSKPEILISNEKY
jgi:hypothetical protein